MTEQKNYSWLFAVLLVIIIILQIVSLLSDKKEVIVNNNKQIDTIINNTNASINHYTIKQIKNVYEYKNDSAIIPYMPDSLLFPEIMRKSREILQYGFVEVSSDSTHKIRPYYNRKQGFKNSSENPDGSIRQDSERDSN